MRPAPALLVTLALAALAPAHVRAQGVDAGGAGGASTRAAPGALPAHLAHLDPASPQPGTARFVFSLRGVPVGEVRLTRGEGGAWRYWRRHLHTRAGHHGAREEEARVRLAADGRTLADAPGVVAQAAWLATRPPLPGCVTGREELGGREGPHCVTRVTEGLIAGPVQVGGTLLGAPFRARYDPDVGGPGSLVELEVGEARFTRVGERVALHPPPELFADGLAVPAGSGPLALVPAPVLAARPPGLTDVPRAQAERWARAVEAHFVDKRPGDADLAPDGEGDAGGCLAHGLRYLALARRAGHRAALVHGLLVGTDGRARPHAWVRVGTAGGGARDLDPTSLEPVRPDTHVPLALVPDGASAAPAGEAWLDVLAGRRRLVRSAP